MLKIEVSKIDESLLIQLRDSTKKQVEYSIWITCGDEADAYQIADCLRRVNPELTSIIKERA